MAGRSPCTRYTRVQKQVSAARLRAGYSSDTGHTPRKLPRNPEQSPASSHNTPLLSHRRSVSIAADPSYVKKNFVISGENFSVFLCTAPKIVAKQQQGHLRQFFPSIRRFPRRQSFRAPSHLSLREGSAFRAEAAQHPLPCMGKERRAFGILFPCTGKAFSRFSHTPDRKRVGEGRNPSHRKPPCPGCASPRDPP